MVVLQTRSGRVRPFAFIPFLFLFALFVVRFTPLAFSQPQAPATTSVADQILRKQFFVSQALQERIKGASYKGALVREEERPFADKCYSVVTSFSRDTFQTVGISGAKEWIEALHTLETQNKTYQMGGVPIQEMTIPLPNGGKLVQYWVGNRAFESLERAADSIRQIKSVSGRPYEELASQFQLLTLEGEQVAERIPEKLKRERPEPLFKKKERRKPTKWEEKLEAYLTADDVLPNVVKDFKVERYLGHRASGGKMYDHQNFGVAKYMNTSFDRVNFNSESAYYTNRLIVRGLKLLDSSVDPYVEATVNLEATGRDFQNTIVPVAGLEYRPFRRNIFLTNEDRLSWLKNLRFFVQYQERKNIHGEIAYSSNNDFRVGADLFYRWGFRLPEPGEKDTPWLAQEYFTGTWQNTNFSAINGDYGWVLANEFIIGYKLPPIPVPQNPFVDNIQFVPHYMMNIEYSMPGVFYQNRFMNAFGVMWFPFRSEKYRHIPQLHEVYVFFRYRGAPDATFQEKRPSDKPGYDLELGIDYTIARF